MNTKQKILAILEKHRGKSISGEEIAKSLNISRTAVWKAVNALKSDGHKISAGINRGYTISDTDNILSTAAMLPHLYDQSLASKIYIYKTLDSTSKTAKEMAVSGCEHGTVIISDTQTSGRGRYGRSFYSPPESGLYMSIVLKPKLLNLTDAALITSAAAVAVCRAIQTVTGKETKIKWVNDILLNDKKVCGILTEAVTDFESGNVDWIIVGIGVNVTTADFPNEVQNIATSLFPDECNSRMRIRLASEILNVFLSTNGWVCDESVRKEYKNRSALLNKIVTVTEQNETYEAFVLDIDERCRLVIKEPDGTVKALSSGEVFVRPKRLILC